MRDTTLNAIAITVFGVTMASLVGPLVDLSPAVVAGFAAVGLGVASLDQLGLGGRLGEVVTDAVAWASPEHRQRVLHHEAGHLLTAVLLDLPVEGYTLNAWESWRRGIPGQGGVMFGASDPAAHQRLTAQVVDRYCLVWMAGIAAEQLVWGSAQGGGNDTVAMAQFWTALGRSPDDVPLKQRWATLQAKTLIANHRHAFDALVTAMGHRASVADCRAAIAQHSDLATVTEPSPSEPNLLGSEDPSAAAVLPRL